VVLHRGGVKQFSGGSEPLHVLQHRTFFNGNVPLPNVVFRNVAIHLHDINFLQYSLHVLLWWDQGRIQSPPTKTYKNNFIHHNFVQIGKQHLQYKAIFSSIVCHSNAVKYTSPLLQQRGCYETWPRGVTRLDGTHGKKQVWRPNIQNWGLLEANVLYWRKYLSHCWDFFALSQPLGAPAVIWRPHSDSVPRELCPPCPPHYAPDLTTK